MCPFVQAFTKINCGKGHIIWKCEVVFTINLPHRFTSRRPFDPRSIPPSLAAPCASWIGRLLKFVIQDEYLHFCCTRCRSKKYVPRYAVIFCVNIDSYDHGNISHGHGSTKVGVLFKDHECHEPSIYIYIYIWDRPWARRPPPMVPKPAFCSIPHENAEFAVFFARWVAGAVRKPANS